MSKDEKGFFDWLIEDICNTIEIKGAVEASRDENGKVDKWAATGLSMGLGHTSDDEMATLAGFLGAEGAFDDDDVCDDVYIPPIPESEPVQEPAFDPETKAIFKDIDDTFERLDRLVSNESTSSQETTVEDNEFFETDEESEEFEDTFIGTNLVYADDMKLLSEAGYDEFDLDLMEPEELKEAMEDAGVDTFLYDFD